MIDMIVGTIKIKLLLHGILTELKLAAITLEKVLNAVAAEEMNLIIDVAKEILL